MMSNDGTGKIKQKKVHFSGKPYERSESKSKDESSFMGKVRETVKNLFAPSWFVAKTTPTTPQANATSGALLEQLTAPPLNAGEDLYSSTPKKPTTETNDVTPHPYQISHRFVSPTPSEHNSVPQQRTVSVPYLTHLGGQRIGNSLQPFTPRVNSRPPEIRVSTPYPRSSAPADPPPEPRPSTSRDEPDSTRTAEESRLEVSQASFLATVADPRHSQSEPACRSRTSFLDTSVDLARKSASPNPSSMSKPSFNISLFANSRLANDQTTSLLGIEAQKSPYYPGKTMFGGASSHRKTRLNPGQPYSRNVGIRKMAAKTSPNNAAGTVTSSTARKILDALDSMSSVLGDAKKVPLNTSSMMDSPAPYTPRSYARSSSLRRQTPGGAPPIGRLSTPGAASIAINRQSSLLRETADFSARQRLPVGGVTPEYGPSSSSAMQTPVLPRSGKMRREKSGLHYKAARDDDDDEEESDYRTTDLLQPSFQLPVPANFSLSAFGSPRTNEASLGTNVITKESANRLGVATAGQSASPFRFASPVVNTTPTTGEAGTAVTNQGFQFSSPVAVSQTVKNSMMFGSNGPTSLNAVSSMSAQPFQFDVGKAKLKPIAAKSSEAIEPTPAFGSFGASPTLKKGSVLDALGGGSKSVSSKASSSSSHVSSAITNDIAAKFKPAQGSWECPVCMINNGADKAQCLACLAPKPERKTSSGSDWRCTKCGNANSESGSSCSKCGQSKVAAPISVKNDQKLADKFKPAAGSWECPACMVPNKADSDNCVCCCTSRPKRPSGNDAKPPKWECSECSILNDDLRSSCASCQCRRGVRSNGGVSARKWECATCWVQNDGEVGQCAACTAPKPGADKANSSQSIADRFKKPTGSWDCDVCMVFNESTAAKCMACETPRPGATATSGFSKAPSYQFGSVGAGGFKCETGSANGGFTFGGQKVSADSAKIDAPSTGFKLPGASTDGFKFGGVDTSKPSSGFSFGGSNDKKDSAPSLGFSFGGSNDKKDSAPSLGFTFGASNDKKDSAPSLGFTFGASNDKKDSAPSLGSSFGAPKDSDKKTSGFAASSEGKETTGIGSGLKFDGKDSVAQFGKTDTGKSDASKPIGGFSFGAPKTDVVTKVDSPLDGTKPDFSQSSSASASGALPSTDAIAGVFKFAPMNNDVKATETKTQGFGFGTSAGAAPSFGASGAWSVAPAKSGGEATVVGSKRKQSSDGPASKKSAGFGSAPFNFPANPSTTTSGAPAPTVNAGLFGGQPTLTSAPSAVKPTAAAPTFSFGAPAASTSAATTGSAGFGFTFGATKPEDIAKGDVAKTPTFGAAPVNAAPPTFGGGQTVSPLFGGQETTGFKAPAFGSGSGSAFGSGTVFGSTPATTAPPSFGAPASKPTFGAPGTSAPVFGQQSTPSPFAMGTASSNDTASFGAKSTAAATTFSASTTSGFNFTTAAQPASSSTGGFNFGAATAPSSGGVFQFGGPSATATSAPPYNFQAGSTAPAGKAFVFSGQPTPGPSNPFNPNPAAPISGRKIKKAHRRR